MWKYAGIDTRFLTRGTRSNNKNIILRQGINNGSKTTVFI